MRLSRVFIDQELTIGSTLPLPKETTHYLKNVLRLKSGQRVVLFNGENNSDYQSTFILQGKNAHVSIESSVVKNLESEARITLLQAIGKPEHIDLIVQKTTELGISNIIFFNSERTQTPIKGDRLNKKIDHWSKIATSACEQSGRNTIPPIKFIKNIKDQHSSFIGNRILLDFNGKPFSNLLPSLTSKDDTLVMIGPEGGFTEPEVEMALVAGYQSCVLGPRVLRMETAAIAAVSLLQHHLGDLD